MEELPVIFDGRNKEPTDYRRNGIITIFVGIGLYLAGFVWIGRILEGTGLLVAAICIDILIAGYLYPNTGKELTHVIEEFEKNNFG